MADRPARPYADLLDGLSRASRRAAVSAAKTVLDRAGLGTVAADAGERVTRLAEELQAARDANRELVEKLVSAEVGKAAARWGFVRREDLDGLRDEVAALREVVHADAGLASAAVTSAPAGDEPGDAAAASPAQRAAVEQEAAREASLAGAVLPEPAEPEETAPRPHRTATVPATSGDSQHAADLAAAVQAVPEGADAVAEDAIAATDPANDSAPGGDEVR